MYGVVTKYFRDRGYGFIKGEDGNSYFIHRSKLYGEYIENGYYVSFKTFSSDKGEYNARDVIVIDAPERKKRMAKSISNMDELEKALMGEMAKMIDVLAERVYQTLNFFLQEYYNSYDPVSYRRQYDFLRSAVKVEPKIKGNKVEASVYIDTDSMDNYYNATGYQVASWANQGLHGGMNVGNGTPHVWNDTMDETVNNGELLKLAIQYLKSKGFSVRV